MAIEIRQLSIKSNVVQRATDDAAEGDSSPHDRADCSGAQLDETSRSELLAECRAMVLEMMSRARER
jgi:hypothetical protein